MNVEQRGAGSANMKEGSTEQCYLVNEILTSVTALPSVSAFHGALTVCLDESWSAVRCG